MLPLIEVKGLTRRLYHLLILLGAVRSSGLLHRSVNKSFTRGHTRMPCFRKWRFKGGFLESVQHFHALPRLILQLLAIAVATFPVLTCRRLKLLLWLQRPICIHQ